MDANVPPSSHHAPKVIEFHKTKINCLKDDENIRVEKVMFKGVWYYVVFTKDGAYKMKIENDMNDECYGDIINEYEKIRDRSLGNSEHDR